MYYKIVENEYILAVGKGDSGESITETEFAEIVSAISTKPQETAEMGYRLKTDLTWESYAKEPQSEPDLTSDEIVDIVFGGAS